MKNGNGKSGKKSNKYYSGLQEDSVARTLDGRVVLASGATPFKKGDVEATLPNGETILLECKTKTQPVRSFSVKKEWLEVVEQDSFRMNANYSGVVFNYNPLQQDNYIVMKLEDFKELAQTLYRDGENKLYVGNRAETIWEEE